MLIGPGHRWRWLALVGLALLVTMAEAFGAGLIFLLLGLITDPRNTPELPVVGDIARFAPGVDQSRLVIVVAVAIAIFFLCRSALVFFQTYVQQRIVQNAGAKLATQLMRGYLAMSYEDHLHRNSSELIRNALQSVQSVVSNALVPAVRLLAEIFVICGLLIVLVLVSPLATALAVGLFGPLIWLLMRTVHPRVRHLGRVAQRTVGENLQIAQQSLEGIRDVTLLGRDRYFVQEFARSRKQYARAQYLRASLAELIPALAESLLVVFIVAFFVISLIAGEDAGGTLSTLGVFAYAGLRLQPSLRKIAAALNNLKFGSAAVDDVYADVHRFASDVSPSAERMPLRERLEFDGVTFNYQGTTHAAIRDVNFTVQPGAAIGICGPTGGGKSTLIDLVAGLLVPTEGRVMVDGRSIHEDIAAWHRQLGVVSQSIFLLDGTVRANIALGFSPEDVDEERLLEAVNLAQLNSVIAGLPEGLETVVGERGTRLSGGQRQRVAIARALYRRPDVLLLDEGTSALDNETEEELIAALERLRGKHTIFLVAHRLTSVRNCDRILVVEDGRISDSGTFEELTHRHRLFTPFRS